MRVGFVTGEYPPMQGGVGDVTRKLARTMAAQGQQIHVFTRIQVEGASEPNIEVLPAVNGQWGWSTHPLIRAWAANNRLDVIDIQFQTAAYNMHPSIHWLPDSIRAVPVVVTFHDLRVPYLFPKAGPARKWIVRRLARRADGVITTNYADESTLRDSWRIEHVRRIPIGSSISAELPHDDDRPARRAEIGIGPDNLLIGYFGFLNYSKGGLLLLEALRQLTEQSIRAHLVMIGERVGSSDPTNAGYAAQMDEFIKLHSLEAHVHWTGFVEGSELSAWFHDCDLIALPYLDGASLRRSSLMTALAHARPIVTTTPQMEIPELADAIEVVPPGDPEALAASIVRLWQDPTRRQVLEQAAGLAAGGFGWESIAQRTLDFFDELTR